MAERQRISKCECGKFYPTNKKELCEDCFHQKIENEKLKRLEKSRAKLAKKRAKNPVKSLHDDPLWWIYRRIIDRAKRQGFYVERSWRYSYPQFKRYMLRLGYLPNKCRILRKDLRFGYRYGNIVIHFKKGIINNYFEIENRDLDKLVPRKRKQKNARKKTNNSGDTIGGSCKGNHSEINS